MQHNPNSVTDVMKDYYIKKISKLDFVYVLCLCHHVTYCINKHVESADW